LRRGELFRVRRPDGDVKVFRVFVVVSRKDLCDSRHSTVVCAPVHSAELGLATEFRVGPREGLVRDSVVRCDDLRSVEKSRLTDYVGSLSPAKISELDNALRIALDLE